MKITLNDNADQIELLKAVGSRDPAVSRPAIEALAQAMGPVIRQVLLQASTVAQFYRDWQYNEDDSPSLPLDMFYSEDVNLIPIWSQSIGGGLATAQVESYGDLKFQTYRLDSAVSFAKKYARRSNLQVVAKAIERMTNELVNKCDRNGWSPLLRGLAEAQTKTLRHVIRSAVTGTFQLDDLNKLMTRVKRINTSYANGGTPSNLTSRGLTDLVISSEIKEQVRGFSYQPMNTRAGSIGSTTSNTSVPLPDAVRQQIYNAGGSQELFGVTLHELSEFGVAQKYNTLFGVYAGATTYGGTAFTGTNSEIVVGLDLSRDAFIRPVATQSDANGQVSVLPDDQFVSRSDKAGFYAFVEEGRILSDARAICGIIV